ncbi:MAG: glycine--tRNA ligase subunit beta [Desulfobulbaceae bacterium]|nr:MAG: glycine--tRNA ligase subunit beta [Desulfobulbaceae bacterium]
MNDHELLFEIGAEEIPAGYIMPALAALRDGLVSKLRDCDLAFAKIRSVATPRRLAVGVNGLIARQPDRVFLVLGPPKKAAFDAVGNPTKAAHGFAATKGVKVEDLQVVQTSKGEYLQARIEQPGRTTPELLAEILPQLIATLPFPKSMRWGTGNIHFARPLRWLLALYADQPLAFSLEGLSAGTQTQGHRFLNPTPFSLKTASFTAYLDALRQAQVLADPKERRDAVTMEIRRAAAEVGGIVLPDDELVETNTNLVEAPFAICGSFSERFLELPREVLITSMREHQKYFALTDQNHKLLPRFVAVNNTRIKDSALGVKGHQRVLRARLEDAFFFFSEDQKRPLTVLAKELRGIIFQAQLGTMADKSARIGELASHLAHEFAPNQVKIMRRAAELCKADLLTLMVREFPSLQGVIGRDYAYRQGESPEVAEALHSHYLPLRAGGQLPKDRIGTLLGIADRLDSLAGCFGIGLKTTGAADPFGLRRQALGLIHLLLGHKIPLPLAAWIDAALKLYGDQLTEKPEKARSRLLGFIRDRFANDLIAQGVPTEAVEAVLSVDFNELNNCRQRIEALVAVSGRPAFSLLAAAFKRVNNIIADANRDNREPSPIDPALLREPAERDLATTLIRVEATAEPLLNRGDYRQALEVILQMKEPVDQFFEQVMVMAEDKGLRRNRLALLTQIASLFHRVGDFSKMYALQKNQKINGQT